MAQAIANGEAEFTEASVAAMNMVPEEYRGLDRFEARKRVVADITAEGLAVSTLVKTIDPATNSEHLELVPYVENKKIMQPFGDRSKVVIEPMLTDQWFVDTDKIVGPALESVRQGDVKIIPESGEKVFYHWLENIEPWCISRQLWWGHQIPVWYGPAEAAGAIGDDGLIDIEAKYTAGGNKIFCAATEAEIITMAAAHYDLPVRLASDDDDITDGEEVVLYRDPDVLDTWFSSGLWPFGTLGWPEDTNELAKYFPGDVLITGQDILFFWVARMMMMSQAVLHENPFHTVYLHQLVRDAKGEKMSKTRGNVIDPLDMIDLYGADALRMSNAAMAAIGGVLKISEDRIKGYRNFGTKLWNACRFAEMNDAVGSDGTIPTPTAPVNKWIIGETGRVREEVDAALTAYRFNDAANALYAFVWGKVCDWYVELSKPLLMDGDGAAKEETQATMAWVLDQCLVLLHPIMPFITEELWGTLGTRSKMLVHADWPTYTAADLVDAEADAELGWTIAMIEGVRSARAQMNVPAGLKIPVLQLNSDAAAQTAWDNNQMMIKRLARIDSMTAVDAAPKGSLTVATPGATFALPLADIIDVDAEKERIAKSLGKVEKEAGGLRGRLNNPKFVASAPDEIVAEAKANLALREEEIAQLSAALDRLNEI
jgi:valyl-tRNA synthetase